jgi:hypothetical protein
MKAIDAGVPVEDAPAWAVLERRLLELLGDAVAPTLAAYYDGGDLRWPADGGGLDDAYECFSNLPLVYALGGDEAALEAAIDHWEHVTERFARGGPGDAHVETVEEYYARQDWMHMGEGNQLFYHVCLAVPDDGRFRERAERFAELYLPDGPGNYDPERRMIVAPNAGSEGPGERTEPEAQPESPSWGYADWKGLYNLPFADVEGVETAADLRDEEKARRMGTAVAERWGGDTAVNLGATSLVTNAYLLSGEERYREWVLEYVEAWRERTAENGGIVPDNVGPSGEIGEFLDGRWYGNYYGWTWPHGWSYVGETAIAAGENAALLDGGDDVHFEMARSTIDALVEAGIEREDTLYVPFKHGEAGSFDYGSARNPQVLTDETGDVLWRDGWFEFRPMPARHPVHLVEATRAEEDIARLERLRNRAADASTTVDAGGKDAAGNEAAWAGYLAGEFPDYPERILQHCIAHAAEKLAVARDLPPEFVPGDDEFLNRDSPFDVEGLVHCTLGGSMPLYNGGLLRTRVRHFDPGRDRPGLPPDVAALVTDIGEGRTELELVNLAATDRAVIVQGGTYGEHVFGDVTYDAAAGDGQDRRVARVDGNALRVSLPGGTRTSLELETRRFAADPASAAPWDR